MNIIFNLVTLVFLVLAIVVGIVIIGVATGSMDSPILAPGPTETVPPLADEPTPAFVPTFTPSGVPGAMATPTETSQ